MSELEKEPFNFFNEDKYKINYSKNTFTEKVLNFILAVKSIPQRLNPEYHQFQASLLFLSSLKESDINSLIQFMKESQKQEISLLIDTYWKCDGYYSYSRTLKQENFITFKKTVDNIKNIYDTMIVDLHRIFQLISNGHYNALGYNEKIVIKDIMQINSRYKTKTHFVRNEIMQFIQEKISVIKHHDSQQIYMNNQKKSNPDYYSIFD